MLMGLISPIICNNFSTNSELHPHEPVKREEQSMADENNERDNRYNEFKSKNNKNIKAKSNIMIDVLPAKNKKVIDALGTYFKLSNYSIPCSLT